MVTVEHLYCIQKVQVLLYVCLGEGGGGWALTLQKTPTIDFYSLFPMITQLHTPHPTPHHSQVWLGKWPLCSIVSPLKLISTR